MIALLALLAACGGEIAADPAWTSTDDLAACTADQGAWIETGNAEVIDDELVVEYAYEGGCATHQVTVCWPLQTFYENDPPLAKLELLHDDGGDTCTDWITGSASVDLTPLAEKYAELFGSESGEIGIVVEGFQATLLYRF